MSSDFCRCGLHYVVAWERGHRVKEPLAQDFCSLRGALAIGGQELEGSVVNARGHIIGFGLILKQVATGNRAP
jgi:hypothetical protein